MAQKKTVKFTGTRIEVGEIKVARRNISQGQMGQLEQLGVGADSVVVELNNIKHAKINVSGGDITYFNVVASSLDELVGLILNNLGDNNQKEDVQEIASGLLKEAQKPEPEKNTSKIRRLVESLGGYIGLATLAATQVEKSQQLFEKVQQLLTGG